MPHSIVPASAHASARLPAIPSRLAEEGQYLSFHLDDAHYALPILRVQEIRRREPVTRLPENPPALRGVLNLRGAVLPVLGLRDLLQMPTGGGAEEGVMIVVNLGERLAGLLVDGVSDVVMLQSGDIRPVPSMLPGSGRGVVGIATADERMLLLLDLAHLLGLADADPLSRAA